MSRPQGAAPPRVLSLDAIARQRGEGRFRANVDHLTFVEAGSYVQHVGPVERAIGPGDWVWTRAGTEQRMVGVSRCEGATIMFDRDQVDLCATQRTPLPETRSHMVWHPGRTAGASLRAVLNILSRDATRDTMTTVLLHELTVLLLLLAPHADEPPSGGKVFVAFKGAVEQGFLAHHGVSHYAKQLAYSPRTLTRACREAVGVGAKEYIDSRLVTEAKRLLKEGDAPVFVVARDLGFTDPSNFVKFFSRRAGCSPSAFREAVWASQLRPEGVETCQTCSATRSG